MTPVLRTRLEAVAGQALAKWGPTLQVAQAQEELAELIAAISHARRRRPGATAELVGEIADALIMVEQLRQLFPELVAAALAEKLDRLDRATSTATAEEE